MRTLSVFSTVSIPAHVSVCTQEKRDPPRGEFLEGARLIQKECAFTVLGNTAKLAFLRPLPTDSPTTALSISPAHVLLSEGGTPCLSNAQRFHGHCLRLCYILSLKCSSDLVQGEGREPYPSRQPQIRCHLLFTPFPDSLSCQGPFHLGFHICVRIILL